MKNTKRKLILSLLMLLAIIAMTGCKNKDEVPDDTEFIVSETEEETETELEIVEEDPVNINLLTGMPDLTEEAMGKRPVAVMVNNVKAAFPQYGIAQADIIFEIPVEGGLTRFMAMYGDYTQVPKICSVRSCRPYFPAISEGFDAVYVNWGMMDEVKSYVKTLGLTQYDGKSNDGGLFSRDSARRNAGYSLEHTSVFDGTRLAEVMASEGKRTDIEEDKQDTAFSFYGLNEQVVPNGEACTVVNVDFGSAEATLVYDETTNTYLKEYNGSAQIDGVTGTQLAFTNVLVLETQIKTASNGIHRDVNWHGGNGYYISNGAVQKITWSKANEQSRILLFDEVGNELTINRGKSYIAINYKNQTTLE